MQKKEIHENQWHNITAMHPSSKGKTKRLLEDMLKRTNGSNFTKYAHTSARGTI